MRSSVSRSCSQVSATKSAEDDDDQLQLKGQTIQAARGRYHVLRVLGTGGFGAVYCVRADADSQIYAMKCEKKTKRDSKLKMELAILRLVSSERRSSHFTQIIDRGRTSNFYFLVMELVGKSLADLKMARPSGVFSMPTGLRVAMQCLEACEDLHKHGFIHRDIKPPNFACGLASKRRLIYILDFGISRRIIHNDGELKTPRNRVKFKGTVRFAAIACHNEQEMGFKDDCEAWFYLLIDLVRPNGLPWRMTNDRPTVLLLKEECRTVRRDIFLGWSRCWVELGRILDYFDELKYHNRVDYQFVYTLIDEMVTTCGSTMSAPYDWE